MPLALSEARHWDEALFSARYEIQAQAGTLDVLAPAEECAAAKAGIAKYHADWVAALSDDKGHDQPGMAEHNAARRAQGRLDDAHLKKICAAAGHYVAARGGRLQRASE